MLKKWVEPQIRVQEFEANEYVAACVKGQIACALPGTSTTRVNDGTKTYVDSRGAWHGLCGNWADISFDNNEGTGYENDKGVIQYDRQIKGVPKGDYEAGKTYNISWQSSNDSWSSTYYHTGQLKVSSVDPNRPNHS